MKNLFSSLALLAVSLASAYAQPVVPIYLDNTSGDFTDDQIYVALIGQNNNQFIWMDFSQNDDTGAGIVDVDPQYNTLQKNGEGYGNIFTKLSDIKDKTIYVKDISACRIFFSFGSPMYLKLFADGYAGANLQNPSDPNAGIRWEIIEFTNAPNGMWINTSRVDAYQYPMGVELWGAEGSNNAYMKAGDLLSHDQMLVKWQSQLGNDPDFSACLRNVITTDNLGAIIEQPSKLSSFQADGSSADYFQGYIDDVWDYFSSHTLTCYQGERGVWTGKVVNDAFTMTSEYAGGTTAVIYSKPTTQAVIEGKDALASGNVQDLALQAQFCGALTRGAIKLTEEYQNWGDESQFFQDFGYNVYNKYVWFFHQEDVSFDGKTYAFAYDDTFDQSSTLVTSIPKEVKISIGGFLGDDSGKPAEPVADYDAADYDCLVVCRDALPDGNALDLRDAAFYVWDNTLASANVADAYEGSEAKAFTVSAAQGGWFGAGYNVASKNVDLTNLKDFNLKFAYKTDYPGQLKVKLSDAQKREFAVVFSHTADNQWHTVSIPVNSFVVQGFDLGVAANWLCFSIVGENIVSTGNSIVFDDIYFEKTDDESDGEGGSADNDSGSGQASATEGRTIDYTYSFSYSGGVLTVSFDVVNAADFTGLVTEIYDITDGKNETTTIPSPSASKTYLGYSYGQTVTFKVKWMYAGGDAFSQEHSYTISRTTGIDDAGAEPEISIAPTFAANSIEILGVADDARYEIYNLDGAKVAAGQGKTANVSGLTRGIYLLKVAQKAFKFRKN